MALVKVAQSKIYQIFWMPFKKNLKRLLVKSKRYLVCMCVCTSKDLFCVCICVGR